ncbi:MAG: bifunctional folylpolyglutamate synthase/dihydrofolate synthase [Eubacterium sp.]|nr:bifunctional folylpolyglutamate synthase/dihydrofolate synthase [Eubacterium sp.]
MDFLNAPRYARIHPGLGAVRNLLERLGNPQDKLKYIHVAGTNGKGSTSAFLDSILRASGYHTGLYTSPYLEEFTERIRLDGRNISEEELIAYTERVKLAVESMEADGMNIPTIFEIVTSVAFLYYSEQPCDIVVLEVGMGGRLDATNIIREAEISVITVIDLDHVEYLGDTIGKIAYEKAGIIKDGGRVVVFPQEPEAMSVFETVCRERSAELLKLDENSITSGENSLEGQTFSFALPDLKITLLGEHQRINASAAVLAALTISDRWQKITEESIREGLLHAKWPGRLELISRNPYILLDGAHNPNGIRMLAENLRLYFPGKKIRFVFGVLADKDYESMIGDLVSCAECFYTVTPDSERALDAERLAEKIRRAGVAAAGCASIEEAFEKALKSGREACKKPQECSSETEERVRDCIDEMPAKASKFKNDPTLNPTGRGEEEVICACGSLYFIGGARTFLMKNRDESNG